MFFPANIEKFEYISHRISEQNKQLVKGSVSSRYT